MQEYVQVENLTQYTIPCNPGCSLSTRRTVHVSRTHARTEARSGAFALRGGAFSFRCTILLSAKKFAKTPPAEGTLVGFVVELVKLRPIPTLSNHIAVVIDYSCVLKEQPEGVDFDILPT
jgi:hypothetical protein